MGDTSCFDIAQNGTLVPLPRLCSPLSEHRFLLEPHNLGQAAPHSECRTISHTPRPATPSHLLHNACLSTGYDHLPTFAVIGQPSCVPTRSVWPSIEGLPVAKAYTEVGRLTAYQDAEILRAVLAELQINIDKALARLGQASIEMA
ncbi:hypothetical protein S7711_10465 [Stachybotrys chartarum IBT 7711]|uniref:Uncharacterized protein n=1 Tax=Stachybotrys chartarum (strain CBS 109288 / IBT 7711) TaxID=1280523 RepID=A0A084B6Z9_STACB|nr:hypothetical protein S7711_10465 [Stachybotrys chartarum IBT 7711]